MAGSEKAIFLKQSGESFSRGAKNGEIYTEEGLRSVAESIAVVYHNRAELGVSGITVVPGAGNIVRGGELKKIGLKRADAIGRQAIDMNATALAEVLEGLNVPVELVLPHSMGFWDNVGEVAFSVYDKTKVKEDYADGKVVIVGGGAGMDNRSTDYAAIYYALPFAEVFDGQVIVLKSTKFDGVFDSDPAKNPDAKRYKVISAEEMLSDYDRFSAVDKPSLELLAGSSLQIHVYAEEEHRLIDVIKHQSVSPAETTIGTIIVGQACEPVFYN